MDNQNKVYQLCLQAFTEVFAIVSHELKNNLAIINENSGLLDDLIIMSGETLESRRVKTATTAIAKQVGRADKIIKTMNRFAHSADLPVSTAPMRQILADVVDLTARKAAGAELSIEIECDENITFTGALPVMESTLYKILFLAYSSTEKEGKSTLNITATKLSDFIKLNFTFHKISLSKNEEKRQQLHILCNYLQAELNEECTSLILPAKNGKA